jgi:hypothetical protein
MFERFTDRARRVVVQAQHEARTLDGRLTTIASRLDAIERRLRQSSSG